MRYRIAKGRLGEFAYHLWVTGEPVGDFLAVRHDGDGRFVVDHVPTGYSIPIECYGADDAALVAWELAADGDWSGSSPEAVGARNSRVVKRVLRESGADAS